jgi:c-di-GMP-binding flagellar brake protein YcgR
VQVEHLADRRRHLRVPYGAWVEDLTRMGSLSFYLSRNLSQGGLLLENQAGAAPPVGTEVRLRLVVENESQIVNVDGHVVRHAVDINGSTLFAVEFTRLDQGSESFLESLISELGRVRMSS